MDTSEITSQSTTTRKRKAGKAAASRPATPREGSAADTLKTAARAQAAQQARQAAAVQSESRARQEIDAQQWQQQVAEAAYFRAELRGFVGGSPEQDWFEAENELRRQEQETRA
ncbi:MAG: DUF2934 domain-containing protein [Burkholderiales bacterium]|nr:DUF2934 domain-containing protein [Burkholderiales bacterium]